MASSWPAYYGLQDASTSRAHKVSDDHLNKKEGTSAILSKSSPAS